MIVTELGVVPLYNILAEQRAAKLHQSSEVSKRSMLQGMEATLSMMQSNEHQQWQLASHISGQLLIINFAITASLHLPGRDLLQREFCYHGDYI